ncbi:hypothetical protein BX616_010584 [Lobosporangium transversale]|nr:hypothetical protein BX616_010584 [Lobosporangium transversale]
MTAPCLLGLGLGLGLNLGIEADTVDGPATIIKILVTTRSILVQNICSSSTQLQIFGGNMAERKYPGDTQWI